MTEYTITVSELQTFMRCRRKWDYSSHSRQSLVRVGSPQTALHIGSMVHCGIEAAIHKRDPLEAVDWYAEDEFNSLQTEYINRVGTGWSQREIGQYWEQVEKAKAILREYFAKWDIDDPVPGFTYIPEGVERTFKVPLLASNDMQIMLGGTFDALIRHNETGKVWILDHKTFSRPQTGKDFSTNFQFNSYMWAAERLFGVGSIGGFIYDGISTVLPTEPEVLKSGKLTKRKNLNSSPATYLRTIEREGLDPKDYEDVLERLEEKCKGYETPFHYRTFTRINRALIRSHEKTMMMIAEDIARSPNVYPNLRWEGCWDCGYKTLCHAELFEEDSDWVKRNKFMVKRGTYGTTKRLKLSSTNVSSIDDLMKLDVAQDEPGDGEKVF